MSLICRKKNTVEALVSGHLWDAKGGLRNSGAFRSRECKNTELVWELRKTRFCEGGRKWNCPHTRVSVRRAFIVCYSNQAS